MQIITESKKIIRVEIVEASIREASTKEVTKEAREENMEKDMVVEEEDHLLILIMER
jgi:hypothetical protein